MNAFEAKVLSKEFGNDASQLKSIKTLFEQLLAEQCNS
jgi:hypothetical protein